MSDRGPRLRITEEHDEFDRLLRGPGAERPRRTDRSVTPPSREVAPQADRADPRAERQASPGSRLTRGRLEWLGLAPGTVHALRRVGVESIQDLTSHPWDEWEARLAADGDDVLADVREALARHRLVLRDAAADPAFAAGLSLVEVFRRRHGQLPRRGQVLLGQPVGDWLHVHRAALSRAGELPLAQREALRALLD